MSIHPLLDRFEYYLVLKESCSYIPIELLGYLLVMRTEITQLKPEITRIFLVYRGQKIVGIHQKHIRMKGWLIRRCAGGGKDCQNHSMCRIPRLALQTKLAVVHKTNKLLIARRHLDVKPPTIGRHTERVLSRL